MSYDAMTLVYLYFACVAASVCDGVLHDKEATDSARMICAVVRGVLVATVAIILFWRPA